MDIAERLSAAYTSGTDEALERWAATGRAGVLLLREFLEKRWNPPPAAEVSSRDLVDNISALVAAIAEAEPEAFLEVFEADGSVPTGSCWSGWVGSTTCGRPGGSPAFRIVGPVGPDGCRDRSGAAPFVDC